MILSGHSWDDLNKFLGDKCLNFASFNKIKLPNVILVINTLTTKLST